MLHRIKSLNEDGGAIPITDPAAAQQYATDLLALSDLTKQINALTVKKTQIEQRMAKLQLDASKKIQANATIAKAGTAPVTTPKPTGTVDTAGNPVNANGSPAKVESYHDILNIKQLNEEKFNVEMVEPDDLQDLKNYMDAESISYAEDEDNTTLDFNEDELDDEWLSQLQDMGLKPIDDSVETKDILDVENDDTEELDDDKDITDVHDEIDEEKVFYVEIKDADSNFTGKIYKLFDDGDWRAKVVEGNSETFEKLNYDPDWDEFDIIAFLRENYDDAELLDKSEFNDIIEDKDVNESISLDKIYKYFMLVNVNTLDRSKEINKIFFIGYTGKTVPHSVNIDTARFKAWKAGHNRRIKEKDLEEALRGNGNKLTIQGSNELLLNDDEEKDDLKEQHHIQTYDEFLNETLKFSDDEEFDTEGELRTEERKDGWYVIGEGILIPVNSKEDGQNIINKMKSAK